MSKVPQLFDKQELKLVEVYESVGAIGSLITIYSSYSVITIL